MLNQLLSKNAIKAIFATATFRQSLVTFTGIAVNGGLAAVFYILAARFLGPESFGIITISMAFLTLASGIFDFGVNAGLVRFVGSYIKKDSQKAKRFLKFGLEIKLAVAILVIILGWWIVPWLSTTIFSRPELVGPLKVSLFGVGATLLFSYIISSLQGIQRFGLWSAVQVGTNLLRLILFLGIWLVSSASIENTLWVHVVSLFVGFVLGLTFLPKGTFAVKRGYLVAREFFDYNKWVAAFILVAAFSSRMDTFISARLLPLAEVGIYGVALQIVYVVPQVVSALSTVIAPKMASMGSVTDLIGYLKKTQALVLGICVLGILAIPVVLFFIPILFGENYTSAGPIFIVLLFGNLIYLASVPIHMSIFYYFSYPKLFFWVSLGHLLITGGLGWILISAYGAIGAAYSVVLGSVFNFAVPLVWVLKRVRKLQ